MNNFNDERDFYMSKLNKPAIITKRHLSTSNNQLSNNDHLLTSSSNININNPNSVDPYMKPLNRKIAISNSTLLQQKNKEESNDISSSNLINLLPSSKLNINSIKYNVNDNLGGVSKESKEQVIKRLKRTELLIGDTYAAQSGPSKLTSANTTTMGEANNQKSSTGIITASSWRMGEVLAQKHLAVQKIDTNNDIIKHSDKENDSKQSQCQQAKKPKRTECHLISTNNNISNNNSIKQQHEYIEKSLSTSNNKSNKSYDLSDVHKYMQLQKTKRLYEIKNEKEKSKRDDEERKKKLQELYRKQRKQLLNNNNNPNAKPTGSSTTTVNNIFSLPIKNENNSDKQSNDQDMSKMLHDKIVHLLNDNDKLVDKQIKQLNMQSSNNSNNKAPKFVSKRITSKHVDFDTNKIFPIADEDNNGNQNIESSLDYSSSATITPNSSHLKYHQNIEDEPLSINISREPIITNHTASSSYNKHDKHDRLKRICSMALELQTKLHQTKLKLFGFNPNDDSFLANNTNQQTNLLASTKINDESGGGNGNDLKNIDDIFADSREKMILLESMFKDNLKEERMRFTNKINSVNSSSNSSNSMSSDLPGIGNYSKQNNHELTQDLAARKIQYAYRLYAMRRKYKNINKQLVTSYSKKTASKIKKDTTTTSNQAKTILTSSNLNTIQTDEYNFINIYRKRVTIESTNQKENENIKSIKNTNNVSVASNSSSSSSSSDSTSISKYISNTNKTQTNNLSRKVSSKVDAVLETEHGLSSSSSIESNSVVTSSTSKSSTSSSSSSSSSGSSTVTSSTSSSTSTSVITTSDNSNMKYALSSKSNQIKPSMTIQNKKIYKIKKILDEQQEQKESRYSPSSLERMLSMGINYLDTLNNSALHLEELDKVRCIGLAQQETVALASLLKNQTNPISINESSNSNIKTERIITSKPATKLSRNEKNNCSSQSLSSTLSSSSSLTSTYTQSNEKENESDLYKESKINSRNIRKTAKKSDSQDISTASGSSSSNTANTVSDNTFERKNATGSGMDEDEELEKSFRQLLPSESHIKKTKQDHAKSDNKDQSILMDLSHSSFYQNENTNNVRLSFEDDSFKKFTGEIVKKYMQEEEMRSKHQAHLLKLREKALIDKTNAELAWLEQMKKKAQDKGEDEKMPSILKKEKGIIQKLKEEQDNINKMKEVQRKATENRLKILSQHSEVIKWCQNKLKKQTSNHLNASANIQDNTFDMSYNESEIDFATTEEDDQHNQFDESNINQSLIESKLMKKVTHLNSEKYVYLIFLFQIIKMRKL
jgi:hypothetical protein